MSSLPFLLRIELLKVQPTDQQPFGTPTEEADMKALILAAALMALAHPANAQGTQCGPREEFLQILRERYGETRQVHGLSSVNGALTEFYASTETGTWSIIVTIAGGESCLVADGVYFEREDNDPAPSGDPA